MTTWSLAWALSSGGTSCCWPCVAVLISASTRDMGTGLPLTVATFCAITARGSTRAPISAAEDLKFMLGDFRTNGFGRGRERVSSRGFHHVGGEIQVEEIPILLDTSKAPIEKLYRESSARKQSGSDGSDFIRRAGVDGE